LVKCKTRADPARFAVLEQFPALARFVLLADPFCAELGPS
jgi:hypothetical protein